MADKDHNNDFSIAVDKALLKLAKEHGIALSKDDPILMQLYLNKEIFTETVSEYMEELVTQNKLSRGYFRKALATAVSNYNDSIKKHENLTQKLSSSNTTFFKRAKIFIIVLSLLTLISLSTTLVLVYLSIFGS